MPLKSRAFLFVVQTPVVTQACVAGFHPFPHPVADRSSSWEVRRVLKARPGHGSQQDLDCWVGSRESHPGPKQRRDVGNTGSPKAGQGRMKLTDQETPGNGVEVRVQQLGDVKMREQACYLMLSGETKMSYGALL